MHLKQFIVLVLSLIIGNVSVTYAHFAGGHIAEHAKDVFQAGYTLYFVFLVGGYLLMYWEIPQKLFAFLFGDPNKKKW